MIPESPLVSEASRFGRIVFVCECGGIGIRAGFRSNRPLPQTTLAATPYSDPEKPAGYLQGTARRNSCGKRPGAVPDESPEPDFGFFQGMACVCLFTGLLALAIWGAPLLDLVLEVLR